ncbi:hypothetical protein GDO86_008673 [Hymenochirus boettgeri]|uniref:Cell division cycle associated 5 n=1 Tax=Hymenochirus boettgeri TaxID=247094 RepID=A0A8T2J3R3_9PIPI|nr:hypothetical protein GDO86_008673 [Hymenochirus boettgeri]
MSERKKRSISKESCRETDGISPPKRRSQRSMFSDSPIPNHVVKKSITVRKIMPRKTLPASATSVPQSTPKVAPPRRSTRISPKVQKENIVPEKSKNIPKHVPEQPSVPEIDVLSPISVNIQLSPCQDKRDLVMSQKVRRSYSRLEMSMNSSSFLYSPTKKRDSSDTSTPNQLRKVGRPSLFGFDKLLNSESPEEEEEPAKGVKKNSVGNREEPSNENPTEKALVEELDHNIPGVAILKQKRRKRKVQMIEINELDKWAADMNAEFDEAEKFDLFVE